MITYDSWACWFGGEVSSTLGSNVRKDQGALPMAEAGREERAAWLQGKRGCSAELPVPTAAQNQTLTLPGTEDKAKNTLSPYPLQKNPQPCFCSA